VGLQTCGQSNISTTKLIPGLGKPLKDHSKYRRLVFKLNYLMITRPYITLILANFRKHLVIVTGMQ
uniref:Uncharacterized protein n=1 Tax=Solanum lycopersicum TaxID=4081 RepID=A0A3Q7EUN8_SOLLC